MFWYVLGVPTPPLPIGGLVLSAVWVVPVLLYWLADFCTQPRRLVVQRGEAPPPLRRASLVSPEAAAPCDTGMAPTPPSSSAAAADVVVPVRAGGPVVLLASIEHSLPHLPQCKVVAGGLGKVMDIVARHHPSDILMVHPMVGEGEGLSYGTEAVEEEDLKIVVDGRKERLQVKRQSGASVGGARVEFVLLGHPWFQQRTKQSIYPDPMTRRAVLRFYSLWNQAVGALLVRYKPDIFHCPDFHTAMAPWYAKPMLPTLRVLLVLHNAEYQGTISTDMIKGRALHEMAGIFHVSSELVRKHLIQEGRFNLLKPAVDFVLEQQGGRGICAVSRDYAAELHATHPLLWKVPVVNGLDNPVPEDAGWAALIAEGLELAKASSKRQIQEKFGLEVDASARLFAFVGRLVRQKGVDLLADAAPWLLERFPGAQLVVVGPVGDGFGHYAAHRLKKLVGRFPRRLFVHCEFMRVPKDLTLGTDFCLMPSRDEPFGYVDIEFAHCGAVVVGAQAGGLGKVPGFYYVAQNRENLGRLRQELRTAIAAAMAAPEVQLRSMAQEAIACEFPVDRWQERLLELYDEVLPKPEVGERAGLATAPVGGEAGMAAPFFALVHPLREGGQDGTSTFEPFSAASTQAPVPSAVDAAVENHHSFSFDSFFDFDAIGDAVEEFLVQELNEAELSRRVRTKLDEEERMLDITEVLECVNADVSLEREQHPISKWLLRPTFGMARVHWLVSIGYLTQPVGAFLTIVAATEWGMRGETVLPRWLERFSWFNTVFGSGGLDPPVMNIALWIVSNLASCLGVPLWGTLTMYVQPRRLLSASLLLQAPLVVAVLPIQPTAFLALALVCVQGLVSSGSLLFIVFNFMVTIRADMCQAALRMGILEMLRSSINWLLAWYIFVASPTSIQGTAERPLPVAVTWCLLPIVVLLICMAVLPGLLLPFAPGPYREDRLPGWELALAGKRRSFLLLGLSDCIGALALYPSMNYVAWFLANGWDSNKLGWVSSIFAVVIAVLTLLWSLALSKALVHGVGFLLGVTLLFGPVAMIRALAQEEVSTFTWYGRSGVALGLCMISLFFESVRSSAIWTVKIRVLNSRWRLLSYGTVLITVCSLCSTLSPLLGEFLARRMSCSLISSNQKELADATLAAVVPLSVLQFLLQMLAAPFLRQEMGLTAAKPEPPAASMPMGVAPAARVGGGGHLTRCCTGRSSDSTTSPQKVRKVNLRRQVPIVAALSMGAVLASSVLLLSWELLNSPLPYDAVHHCNSIQEEEEEEDEEVRGHHHSVCWKIKDVFHPWRAEIGHDGSHVEQMGYGPNIYGQDTTGKYNCRLLMRASGGDTFVFWPSGRCIVLGCGRAPSRHDIDSAARQDLAAATDAASSDATFEVWSRHCSMHGQNLVVTHLFEWRWEDVGLECEQYLGPAGFGAVQVSPVTDHILGESWAVRYQPVTYALESRAGNRTDFIEMVARCRKAGVQVLVDVVLNHMAGPYVQSPANESGKVCGGKENTSNTSTLFCEGWTGIRYGNRLFVEGGATPPHLTREEFHHYVDNDHSNCGLPPWTNNRHLCDLNGLPDLNTEMVFVRHILQSFLEDLFSIGVTMLRIDAAAHMYPESIALVLQPFPWYYIVQEFYAAPLTHEPQTRKKALIIGAVSNFDFGTQVGEVLFDTWNGTRWVNHLSAFGGLLQLDGWEGDPGKSGPGSACDYPVCKSAYSPDSALFFLDNHDQQRERWKTNKGGPPESPMCKDYMDCRPMYKHGLQYHLGQRFMLAFPYGDAVRLMSSFAFQRFDQGPPGVRRDSRRDTTARVTCRGTPTTSPVTEDYDNDTTLPWVCEHRWRGVAGLVRLRSLVGGGGQWAARHRRFDRMGHVSFAIGKVTKPMRHGRRGGSERDGNSSVAFVALSRGYNWYTGQGSNMTWSLTGAYSGMPAGSYCDLAAEGDPVPPIGKGWRGCPSERCIIVGADGSITRGEVPSGQVVAIHQGYPCLFQPSLDATVAPSIGAALVF